MRVSSDCWAREISGERAWASFRLLTDADTD